MVVRARIYLLTSLIDSVSVRRRRVPDFEADVNNLRRLGLIGHEVGEGASLVRSARGKIRVEERAKGCLGLRRLEHHSQNGFCVGLGEQLARRFILRISWQARKDGQSIQKDKARRRMP